MSKKRLELRLVNPPEVLYNAIKKSAKENGRTAPKEMEQWLLRYGAMMELEELKNEIKSL